MTSITDRLRDAGMSAPEADRKGELLEQADGTLDSLGVVQDGRVRYWDLETGKLIRESAEQASPVMSVVFSADGKRALTGSSDRTLRLWDLESGKALEVMSHPHTVWDVAFSKDPQQKYVFITDGVNEKVKIIDRQTLQELATFGDGGRQPGQFYGVHSIAIDSRLTNFVNELNREAAQARALRPTHDMFAGSVGVQSAAHSTENGVA